LFKAILADDDERAIALLEAEPALIQTCSADGWTTQYVAGWTPLHAAASRLNERLVAWLLDRGANVETRARGDRTPLDVAAERGAGERFAAVAALLRRRGAGLTARAAVALGETEWLRARHAEGALRNPIADSGGLLRIAVSHDRPEILALLLDFGFDPDERIRVQDEDEPSFSWGMPLWHCAGSARYAMAEMLLERG